MERKKVNYGLAYGYRRFTACKKLGWNTIPAKIQESNEIRDIPLKEITLLDNSRMDDKDEEFIGLMSSIKQHGLLEPVGVWDIDKFSEEDFLTLNIIENEQRKNLSPVELSRAIRLLFERGLNKKEIALRLNIPVTKVESLLGISQGKMSKYLKDIGFVNGNVRTNTKLPYSILKMTMHSRIKGSDKEKIIEYAKKNNLVSSDVKIIINLLQNGMTFKEAIQERDYYRLYYFNVLMDKRELVKNGYDIEKNKSIKDQFMRMLTGKEKLIPSLFFYNK